MLAEGLSQGVSNNMRILFCGGRLFSNQKAISDAFDEFQPTLVITGGANGADSIADNVAKWRGIPRIIFPANWKGDGKAAGPIRNARMLKDGMPELVVAFEGGVGTTDMVAKAKAAGISVMHR